MPRTYGQYMCRLPWAVLGIGFGIALIIVACILGGISTLPPRGGSSGGSELPDPFTTMCSFAWNTPPNPDDCPNDRNDTRCRAVIQEGIATGVPTCVLEACTPSLPFLTGGNMWVFQIGFPAFLVTGRYSVINFTTPNPVGDVTMQQLLYKFIQDNNNPLVAPRALRSSYLFAAADFESEDFDVGTGPLAGKVMIFLWNYLFNLIVAPTQWGASVNNVFLLSSFPTVAQLFVTPGTEGCMAAQPALNTVGWLTYNNVSITMLATIVQTMYSLNVSDPDVRANWNSGLCLALFEDPDDAYVWFCDLWIDDLYYNPNGLDDPEMQPYFYADLEILLDALNADRLNCDITAQGCTGLYPALEVESGTLCSIPLEQYLTMNMSCDTSNASVCLDRITNPGVTACVLETCYALNSPSTGESYYLRELEVNPPIEFHASLNVNTTAVPWALMAKQLIEDNIGHTTFPSNLIPALNQTWIFEYTDTGTPGAATTNIGIGAANVYASGDNSGIMSGNSPPENVNSFRTQIVLTPATCNVEAIRAIPWLQSYQVTYYPLYQFLYCALGANFSDPANQGTAWAASCLAGCPFSTAQLCYLSAEFYGGPQTLIFFNQLFTIIAAFNPAFTGCENQSPLSSCFGYYTGPLAPN